MTFLEKLQTGHPDVIEEYTDAETGKLQYAFGCPWAFGYADSDSLQCATQKSCSECWNREIPEKEPETFRELLQKERLEKVSTEFNGGCSGCPNDYGYESTEDNRKACAHMSCTECWDRKLPKKAEEPVETKIEEEKKMRNLRTLIESKVEDAIASGKIDEYVENIVEDMDLDGEIDDLIETEIRENIDDYVGPILSEAVRDAVREALDNLFN